MRASLSHQKLEDLLDDLNSEKRILNKLIDRFEETATLLLRELSIGLNKNNIDHLKSLNNLIIEEKRIIVAIEQEISIRKALIS